MRTRVTLLVASVILSHSAATPALAQERGLLGPPAVEAVASIANSSDEPFDPYLFFDLAATVPIGDRFGAVVRPYAHRLEGGEWSAEMYQLQLFYQSTTRIPIRVDAGIITSPLGLGTLELRADQSATIKTPFYYYMPLPRFDRENHDVQLISGGYPLGAVVSTSGTKWDLRAGVTDSTPARSRNVFESDRPAAMRQFIVGGGVTPIVGLRVGAGFAHGAYRSVDANSPDAAAPQAPRRLPSSTWKRNIRSLTRNSAVSGFATGSSRPWARALREATWCRRFRPSPLACSEPSSWSVPQPRLSRARAESAEP